MTRCEVIKRQKQNTQFPENHRPALLPIHLLKPILPSFAVNSPFRFLLSSILQVPFEQPGKLLANFGYTLYMLLVR